MPAPDADQVAATPDAPASSPAPVPGPAAAALGEYDREQVHFTGFGAARFGADEAAVRQAWGGRLLPESLAGSTLCYYIEQDPRPAGGGIAFMFEDAKLVRYDVFGTPPGVSAAPGGFTVGARAEDILKAFGSRVEVQPHKYVEGGRYLVLSPEFGEPGRIVFEVDQDGLVTQWRVGVPPQVFYVEGCS
ncbi:lectin [Arenimonas aestuarii]